MNIWMSNEHLNEQWTSEWAMNTEWAMNFRMSNEWEWEVIQKYTDKTWVFKFGKAARGLARGGKGSIWVLTTRECLVPLLRFHGRLGFRLCMKNAERHNWNIATQRTIMIEKHDFLKELAEYRGRSNEIYDGLSLFAASSRQGGHT
jgi:hypothetical protein